MVDYHILHLLCYIYKIRLKPETKSELDWWKELRLTPHAEKKLINRGTSSYNMTSHKYSINNKSTSVKNMILLC
jgi:hypothetical protein